MSVVTVGDLLAEEGLRDSSIIGGRTGLDSTVHEVTLVVTGSELGDAPYGTAAVLDLGGMSAYRRQHLVDIVCRRLAAGAARLRGAGSLDDVMAVLDAMLDARTSLSTTDGTVLAGRAPHHAVTIPVGAPVPAAERVGQVSTAICPVPGTDDSRLWMLSQSERTGPLWRDAALGLLDTAVSYASEPTPEALERFFFLTRWRWGMARTKRQYWPM